MEGRCTQCQYGKTGAGTVTIANPRPYGTGGDATGWTLASRRNDDQDRLGRHYEGQTKRKDVVKYTVLPMRSDGTLTIFVYIPEQESGGWSGERARDPAGTDTLEHEPEWETPRNRDPLGDEEASCGRWGQVWETVLAGRIIEGERKMGLWG